MSYITPLYQLTRKIKPSNRRLLDVLSTYMTDEQKKQYEKNEPIEKEGDNKQ